MLKAISFAASAMALMWASMFALYAVEEKPVATKEVVRVQPGQPKPKRVYYAYKYQWVAYLTTGRVVSGPERFGVVAAPGQPQENLMNFMSENMPKNKEDLPEFVIPATHTAHTVVIFSHLTLVEKNTYEGMRLSKCLSLEILD